MRTACLAGMVLVALALGARALHAQPEPARAPEGGTNLVQRLDQLEKGLNTVSNRLGRATQAATPSNCMEKRLADAERKLAQLERDLDQLNRRVQRLELKK